jgi:hypothetical protein
MKRFIEGTDRGQSTLFPEYLEDWIDEDSLPDEDAAASGHRNGAARPGYNMTRVMSIMGVRPLLAAMRA